MNRKIIHAADVHLDSPLQKLSHYEGAPAGQIRRASRIALSNLVDLAIEQSVDLVVIAGDLFDGDWPDQNTGLFFVKEASRLVAAGIPLVVIRGNHDAANIITRTLPLPRNPDGSEVMLSASKVDSRIFESIGIAVHGKSFLNRVEKENLALSYPPALGGFFNLGLLHTSLGGFEGHDPYAPCTPRELADKNYDYWALGHIHQRGNHEVDGAAPVVYSGNIQGRHIRECGPKGCYLIEVNDRQETKMTFKPLDVVRWEKFSIDAEDLSHHEEVVDKFQGWMSDKLIENESRLLVSRVEVRGATTLNSALRQNRESLLNGCRSVALGQGADQVWVENLKIRTVDPARENSIQDQEGPFASLSAVIHELSDQGGLLDLISDEIDQLKKKMPHDLFDNAGESSLLDQAILQDLLASATAEIRSGMSKAE